MQETIFDKLCAQTDESYADFQRKLIPTVEPTRILGVRTPALRRLAAQLDGTPQSAAFLETLPHTYFEENQLHAFLLSRMRDFDRCLWEVDRFLPYIDNWATCDQLSPTVFARHKDALLPAIYAWLASDRTYTVRFAVGMLMRHFLDADFDPQYPQTVARIRSDEYYVRMMVAWYFATALAKQYDEALPFLQRQELDVWTHNKAIQKAVESYRITPAQKQALKNLKIR